MRPHDDEMYDEMKCDDDTTIICSKIMIFLVFLRKRHQPTDGRTDRRTDPLIEMRGRI